MPRRREFPRNSMHSTTRDKPIVKKTVKKTRPKKKVEKKDEGAEATRG